MQVGPEQGQSSGFVPSDPCPEGRDLHQRGVSCVKDWWWQQPPHRAAQCFVASSSRKQAFLARLLVLGIFRISGSQFNCATSQLPERVEYDHIT